MAENPQLDVKQLIRQEYVRCAKNPQYFIRKYCYIQHPIRGRILFDLYDYQSSAIDDFQKFNYNIILKGRQIGISTATACYALWLMLFYPDKNVLVIATKQETAKNLIAKVKFAFDNLPVWLRMECPENNKLSLKFENGSSIKASTASGDAGRSEALSLLILDEAAFIKNVEEIWVASLPTLSTGGKAVLISTPNGVGNFFHKTWEKAMIGEEDQKVGHDETMRFNPIKLDWRVHPERDQAWRDKMGAIQGEREARQEFDAEFIGSGNTVVDADLIEFFATRTREPSYTAGFDSNLWIWESPNPGRKYMVCADVARGDGTDYSAFHVIDLEHLRQVAEYKGKIDTNDYADMLLSVSVQYMDALLVIENANHGWSVLQRIIDRGYRNLFYMSEDVRVIEPDRHFTNRLNARDKKLVPGFTTSLKTRPVMIGKLKDYMREIQFNPDNTIEINSLRTIQELRVFIWENGKAQAMAGYNDDLIMALAIGLWVRDTALVIHDQMNSMTRVALDKIQRVGHDAVYTNTGLNADPYQMPIAGPSNNPYGTQTPEDLRWLLF